MVPSPRVVVVDSLLTTASSITLFGSELMAFSTVVAESVWRRVLVVNSSLSVERNVRANSTLLQKYASALGMTGNVSPSAMVPVACETVTTAPLTLVTTL